MKSEIVNEMSDIDQIQTILNEIKIKEYKKFITIVLEQYCCRGAYNQNIKLPTSVVLNFAKMLLVLSKNIQHLVIDDITINLEKPESLYFSIIRCPELISGHIHVSGISVFIDENTIIIDINLRECLDNKINGKTKESEITKTFMNISDVVNIFTYNVLIYLLPDNTWDTIKSYPII